MGMALWSDSSAVSVPVNGSYDEIIADLNASVLVHKGLTRLHIYEDIAACDLLHAVETLHIDEVLIELDSGNDCFRWHSCQK